MCTFCIMRLKLIQKQCPFIFWLWLDCHVWPTHVWVTYCMLLYSCIFVSVCISEFVVCILCLNCICFLRFVHRVSYHTFFASSFLSIVANFCLYTRVCILIVMFFVFVLNFKHALYVDGVDNLNFIFLNENSRSFKWTDLWHPYLSLVNLTLFMTCLSRPVYRTCLSYPYLS